MRLALVCLFATAAPAAAQPDGGKDACGPGTKWRGHTVDLDVKDAPIQDVFRLLADVGKVNVVVADDVAGKVTMRVKRVPWDQLLCTVAATKQLRVTVSGSVYLVRRPAKS